MGTVVWGVIGIHEDVQIKKYLVTLSKIACNSGQLAKIGHDTLKSWFYPTLCLGVVFGSTCQGLDQFQLFCVSSAPTDCFLKSTLQWIQSNFVLPQHRKNPEPNFKHLYHRRECGEIMQDFCSFLFKVATFHLCTGLIWCPQECRI